MGDSVIRGKMDVTDKKDVFGTNRNDGTFNNCTGLLEHHTFDDDQQNTTFRKRGRPNSNAARERSRVKTLRTAFRELQQTLPSVPPDTKLSKLDVLVLATTYISHLMRTLDGDQAGRMPFTNQGFMHPVKILIDGPYGSPSTTVYDVDHAIMIAAGIGVTPFASILQSIMFRQKRKRAICPKCNHTWKLDQVDGVILVPKKVDFIWVTRTFSALEWFLGVLSELEEEQALVDEEERFMSFSLHVTSALAQSDIRAVALQMAMELCYEEELRDPLCGLRTRIQPGRPNWRKLLQKTLKKTEGKVCVFYCGPPQLEKILHKICQEFNLDFRSENF